MNIYDSYTDTGIDWIGEIPSHWEVKKMSYISNVITDFVASGSFADLKENVEYLENPDFAMLVRTADLSQKGSLTPVYVSRESYEFLSNSNLFGGEIILPNIGSVGDAYLVPSDLYDKMTLAPNAIMVNTDCNRFFYYFFLSKSGYEAILNIAQGTTQSKFNKTQLRALKAIVPPLVEQEAIADYLDRKCASIDGIIATQERRIALLNELKQSVITEAVTHGINPSAPLRDSGIDWIGQIPQHWERKRIKFLLSCHSDGVWGDEEKGNANDIPCIRVSDFIYDRMTLSNMELTLRNFSKEELEGREIKKGDLLIEKSGGGEISPVGRVVISNNETVATCSNFIHYIRLKSEYNNKFLCYYFNALYANKVNLLYFNQTTGIQNLQISKYLGQGIFVPPLEEQELIANYLDKKCARIDSALAKAKREIKLLREYKQSIITEAITGKIKVC